MSTVYITNASLRSEKTRVSRNTMIENIVSNNLLNDKNSHKAILDSFGFNICLGCD